MTNRIIADSTRITNKKERVMERGLLSLPRLFFVLRSRKAKGLFSKKRMKRLSTNARQIPMRKGFKIPSILDSKPNTEL